MLELALIWIASALAIAGALVLIQARRAGGFEQWQRRNWRSIIVLAAIGGALPAFLIDYFSARNVDLPPELQRRPAIVGKPS